MAPLLATPFSIIDLLLSILLGISALIATFVGALWYWGLDRKTEVYDRQLRSDIKEDAAFSGIRRAARPEFIATSDAMISKFISKVKEWVGYKSEKPDKIVAVEGDTFEERKIEMIRERVREIPGKNILTRDLVATIRNHYAYKLALSTEDVESRVVEHFKSRLEEYEYSQQVNDLAKASHYDDISLIKDPNPNAKRDPLNDVFLRLVRAAEMHCVGPISDVAKKHEEIEKCREHLMLLFFGLWTKRMKGIEVRKELAENDCLPAYRADIRDEDNWGYWLLPNEKCDEEEFTRLRHMAWRMKNIVEEYWDEGAYFTLYPRGGSIREMEKVETPFLIVRKAEDEFRGGGPTGRN